METQNGSTEVTNLIKEIVVLIKQNLSKGFEELGVTMPQSMVIGILHRFGKMKISELSGQLALSNSTVSGIIDRLEKQEMVVRERSLEDKRVVFVSLSPKFNKMHQGFHNRTLETIENIMHKGTPEEFDKIIEGLNTLKKLLINHQK